MQKKKKICKNCRYRDELFLMNHKVHCHCMHPELPESERGWGSLMNWYDTCKKYRKNRYDR